MRYGNPSKKTRVHASKLGHSVSFPGKGSIPKDQEPAGAFVDEDGVIYVWVPAIIAHEVASIGMLAESEIEEAPEVVGPVRPVAQDKLMSEVFGAFAKLKELNGRDDFSGTGVPKAAAVNRLLGYDVNNGEIKDFWGKYAQHLKDTAS